MNTDSGASAPREAVTAILQCGDEVFLARRQPHLASFSGHHAFPGGKVDAEDHASAADLAARWPGIAPRFVNALVRELAEELGFDLPASAQRGELQELAAIGNVATPAWQPVRFDTHFFRVRLARRPAIRLDPKEHADAGWASPEQWLAQYHAGELLLPPPTRAVLRNLAEDPATPNIVFHNYDDSHRVPMIESVHGLRMLMVRSNTLPPARHTNCFLIGDGGPDAPRLLVDPAPADDAELDRLLARIAGPGIDAILLTHHHRDHRERADRIARQLGVPVGMSAYTLQRLREDAPEFIEGLNLRLHADGEVLTRWLGHPVRALAVPGHDAGQLALMPDNRAWCIVGDLIQGIGTVVIAPPEGDMRTYFATLERVIALNPRVVVPSHGNALGGVHYIEAALKHRRAREQQVLNLHTQGQSVEQILAAVYPDLIAPLVPLARINIEGHLRKLREEGRIAA